MRFADLLGEPDDDGSASGSSTTEGPGASASPADTAPSGASGSLGGPAPAPADPEDLTRWFTAEESPIAPAEPAPPETPAPSFGEPVDATTRAQALAAATGAIEPVDATPDVTEEPAEPPAPTSGVARDDLMPSRPAPHGRRRR